MNAPASLGRRLSLVVLLPGCAYSARVGPETKLLGGHPTVEAQGTMEAGIAAGDTPGGALFVPALSLSGGDIPAIARGTGSFEGGGDYALAATSVLSLRGGARFGGTFGGLGGTYLSGRAGAALALTPPELDSGYTVLVLEAFAGPGVSGDLTGTFVGGLALSIGTETYHSFRIPSGRPMRVAGREVVARVARRRDWQQGPRPELRGVSTAARRALGRAWLREARAEHASIATFAQLSAELMACGAPPELVAGAHRAALDEVRHARLCFALAAAYLDEQTGPAALPLPAPATRRPTPTRIAVESLLDGAVGEGWACELAARRRAAATDQAVRHVLGVIRREEGRHARLAWDVVAWTLGKGGKRVGVALRDAWKEYAHRAPSAVPRPRSPTRDAELRSHGVVSSRDAVDALAIVRRRTERRLARELARVELT